MLQRHCFHHFHHYKKMANISGIANTGGIGNISGTANTSEIAKVIGIANISGKVNISGNCLSESKSIAVQNCHMLAYGLRFKDTTFSSTYYTLACSCFVLSIVTTIFNVFALKLFYDRRKSIKTNEVIIAGLACTDIFTGVISFPAFGILNLRFAAHTENCPLVLTAIMCTQFGQLLTISTLTVASIDRYLAIFQPYFYDARCKSPSCAIKALLAVWVFCGIITLVGLVTPRFLQYRAVLLAQVVVIIPFSVLIHIKAYLIARRIDRQVHNQGKKENTKGKRNNAKAARITGTIVAAMCLCYFPQLFGLIYRTLFVLDTATLIILSTMVLVMINSTINPVIYCFQLDSFRKDLRKLLLSKKANESKE